MTHVYIGGVEPLWVGSFLLYLLKKNLIDLFFIIIVKELCEEVLRKKFKKMYVKFVE
jgi:hypothetical protein